MKKLLLLLLLPIFSFGQVINTFPWNNNFENNIPLEQDQNDDGDWLLKQGPTPSFNTGPTGDHTTGNGTYFYSNGTQVPTGTELHHHTIVPQGRTSNFMTQHIMDGNDVDVFTSPPNQQAQITGGPTNEQTTPQTGMGGTTGGGFSY